MRFRSLLVGAPALLWLVACRDREPSPVTDTARDSAAAVTPAGTAPSRWASELGTLLLVPADDSSAVVIFSASAPLPSQDRPVTLVTSAGDTIGTTITPAPADSQVCGEAPTVRLGSTTSEPWSVGLRATAAVPVRVDSLESLSRSDSTRLTAELARLASRVPMRADSRFKGLPFAVFSARRFTLDSLSLVAAYVVRRIANEATPAEEHTMLVAERPTTGNAPYTLAYHERSEGTEDSADSFELLSVLRTGNSLWLLVSRDNVSQTTYELLERSASGWSVRWTRVLSC